MPTDALSGLALSQAISPFRSSAGRLFFADDHERLAADQDDRLEILQEIELQGVEAADQHMRGRGPDRKRIAVRRRTDRAGDAERAGRTSDILDDDRLPQYCPRSFAEEPRQRVGGAACRERNDHGDRSRRVVLRARRAAPSKSDNGCNQQPKASTHTTTSPIDSRPSMRS